MMLPVNGLYGHAKHYDARSVIMLVAMLVPMQVLTATMLSLPLAFVDLDHHPMGYPLAYLGRYGTWTLLASACFLAVSFLRHEGEVRASIGFRYIEPHEDARLWGIVSEQAGLVGMAVPRIAVVETPALNAFACGRSERSAAIVVTRGLLDALDDGELAAVVAHEIAHIRGGDARFMAAAAAGVTCLRWIGQPIANEKPSWNHVLIFFVIPPLLLILIMLRCAVHAGTVLGRLARATVSSSREFVADAEAIRITQDPAALVSALRKIDGRSEIEGLNPIHEAMMIDGPATGFDASHPTIADRVDAIVRLTGAMALTGGRRRDTRTASSSRRAAFGRSARGEAVQSAAASRGHAPARTAAESERIEPLAHWAKFTVPIGVVAMTVLGPTLIGNDGIDTMMSGGITGRMGAQSALNAMSGGHGGPRSFTIGRAPYAAGEHCFKTPHYDAPENAPALSPLDRDLILAHASGTGPTDDARPERHLGDQIAALIAVRTATGAKLPEAQAEYVTARMRTLHAVHRSHGEPGLALLRRAYANPRHAAEMTRLRRTLAASPEALEEAGADLDIVRLLAANPAGFVPCEAKRSGHL